MKNFLRYLLYKSPLASLLHNIVYYKWNRRYQKQEGFLSGQTLHDYLDKSCIHTYHPPEQVSFKRPLGSEGAPLPRQIDFYVGKTFTVSAGEVYEFHNAYLMGENAVGVTHDGKIILDTAMDLPNVLKKSSPRLLMNYNKVAVEKEFDCVVSLVHIFCNNHYVNYFHWLTDSLILLEGWGAYARKTGIRPKILINQNPTTFQRQYLDLIGVLADDLIYWKDYKKAYIQKLIVVKSRRTGTNMDEIVSPHGLQWMKQTIFERLPESGKKPNDRIFLDRRKTSVRRVVNYDELIPILNKYDFEIINADELSVAEQIHVFKKARLVFAIHGAGLTNMFFSEGVKILELIGNVDAPDDFQWYCAYYSMSQALGFDYSFLECEHVPLLQGSKTRQIYDIIVNPELVDQRLNKLLHEF